MELPPIEVLIHIGIGQEDFGRTAFDNYIQDFRPAQLVEGLGRENHCGVGLSPRLECLDDVPLNARILQKHPCLIYKKRLEYGTDLPVANDGVRAMQDIEQERFKNFGVLAHFLEVETLETGKGNRVFRIVEEETRPAPRVSPSGACRQSDVPACLLKRQAFGVVGQPNIDSRSAGRDPVPRRVPSRLETSL